MLEWKILCGAMNLRAARPSFRVRSGPVKAAVPIGVGDGTRCEAQQELLNFLRAALPAFPPSSSFGLGLWAAGLFEVAAISAAMPSSVAKGLRRPDGLLEGATLEYRPCAAAPFLISRVAHISADARGEIPDLLSQGGQVKNNEKTRKRADASRTPSQDLAQGKRVYTRSQRNRHEILGRS